MIGRYAVNTRWELKDLRHAYLTHCDPTKTDVEKATTYLNLGRTHVSVISQVTQVRQAYELLSRGDRGTEAQRKYNAHLKRPISEILYIMGLRDTFNVTAADVCPPKAQAPEPEEVAANAPPQGIIETLQEEVLSLMLRLEELEDTVKMLTNRAFAR